MIRLALAVVAILVLAFSASNAPPQQLQMPFSHNSLAGLTAARDQPAIAHTSMALLNNQSPAAKTDLTLSSADETPAPALLIYLAIVIVGSAIAVGVIRHTQGRKIR